MTEQPDGTKDRRHEGLDEIALKNLKQAEALYRALMRNPDFDAMDQANNKIADFNQKLIGRHLDWEGCAMMHVIAGSGMFVPPERVDFDGEDSILKFLEELVERLGVTVPEK